MDSHRRRKQLPKLATYSAIARALLAVTVQCIGAPPPNDNFVNRTILTGSSNEFTGTLSEATLERDSATGRIEIMSGPTWASCSVWWSWTAVESGPVVLQIIDLPFDSFHSDGIAIWAPSNIVAFPTNQFPVDLAGYFWFDSIVPGMWLTFMAEAGQEYQLQLFGLRRGNFKLRLVSGAAPFIFEQPRSHAVPAGGSALFGVMAAGLRPFYYQWLRDGIELPGEKTATLALNGLGLQDAGGYSVVVSNASGATTSHVARLQVRDVHMRPTLSQWRVLGDQFEFVLNAESNRYYRIESSTNSTAWTPAAHFSREVFSPKTSVVGTSNSTTTIAVSNDAPFKLFRAALQVPTDEVCNNNLRRIRYAKRIWCREFQRYREHTARWSELAPYMNIQQQPPIIGVCPNDGMYYANNMGRAPECTYTNHVFEEPW